MFIGIPCRHARTYLVGAGVVRTLTRITREKIVSILYYKYTRITSRSLARFMTAICTYLAPGNNKYIFFTGMLYHRGISTSGPLVIRASVDALSRDGTDMRGDAQNPKSFQAPRM